VVGPAVLQQPLAVGRHRLDGAAVAALPELPSFAVLHVVGEAAGALDAQSFEDALRLHGAGHVQLAGEEAGATVVVDALDDVDLRFLAGLEGAEIGLDVRLAREPVRGGTQRCS
jgi:hypothetical protein